MALTLQLRAIDLDLAEGAEVATWANAGTAGGNFTQGTAADRPHFRTAGLSGRPALDFDSDEDFLTGAAISNYISGAAYMGLIVFRALSEAAATQQLLQDTSNSQVFVCLKNANLRVRHAQGGVSNII